MLRFPSTLRDLDAAARGALAIHGDELSVKDPDALRGALTDALVEAAVFAPDALVRDRARWLLQAAAWHVGVRSASIHNLYLARGRGAIPAEFTVPALNLRGPTYDQARAAFRAAERLQVGCVVFEIARSEIGYTDQRPGEYAAVVTAAALREGFKGPLFLQGDHFQFSPSKWAKDPQAEQRSIEGLIEEALSAGFRNIDIDASTLVTLEPGDLKAQQALNGKLTAQMADFIRERQPDSLNVSVGGEIGEVGKHNSNAQELEAYVAVFKDHHARQPGLAKISVNTGSSHGGIVDKQGKVVKVAIDLEALRALGEAARKAGAGGAVQHGASTLPEEYFHKFPEVGALEIHLATGFQNLVMDHPALPREVQQRIVAHTKEHCADERKAGDTEEQFVYKTRKKAIGPLKRDLWDLPSDAKARIFHDLEERFAFLFGQLRVDHTKELAFKWALQEPHPPKPARAVTKDQGMGKGEGE